MGIARTLPAAGGLFLAAEYWSPDGELRAQVVFVHGLGEHRRARPYLPFYETLAAHGFGVLAFDLRGHGDSRGARLYARNFAVLEDDLARAIALAADEAEGRPVFVIGGSLGGLLGARGGARTARFARRRRCRARRPSTPAASRPCAPPCAAARADRAARQARAGLRPLGARARPRRAGGLPRRSAAAARADHARARRRDAGGHRKRDAARR